MPTQNTINIYTGCNASLLQAIQDAILCYCKQYTGCKILLLEVNKFILVDSKWCLGAPSTQEAAPLQHYRVCTESSVPNQRVSTEW